jgi:hypothetical protein
MSRAGGLNKQGGGTIIQALEQLAGVQVREA